MLNLDRPRDGDIHTLADFAELLCLCTQGRALSRASLEDHVRDEGDTALEELALDDVFFHFAWRQSAFGPLYPFALDNHGNVLTAPEALSASQEVYALLLLCANLPFLQAAHRNQLSATFERIAFCALRRIMPSPAEVRQFGKSDAYYTGTKAERLKALARDIGCLEQLTPTSFRPGDTGDAGIDLVAWHDLDTYERRNKLSALAQCACSREEWVAKQTEISHTRLATMIVPTCDWTEMVFIPHCFRGNSGNWAVDADVAKVVLVDRLRLIRQIDPAADAASINVPPLLTQVLQWRLPIL